VGRCSRTTAIVRILKGSSVDGRPSLTSHSFFSLADTWNAAKDVAAARKKLLHKDAGWSDRFWARFDATRYFMLQVGLYPALVKHVALVTWDLGELAAHQVAVRLARRNYKKKLEEEPDQDSVVAVKARGKIVELRGKALSFEAMVERAALTIRWGLLSTIYQVLGGTVGTFFFPGVGTYVGELGSSLLLNKPAEETEWDFHLVGF
jgi:hypothetical protein